MEEQQTVKSTGTYRSSVGSSLQHKQFVSVGNGYIFNPTSYKVRIDSLSFSLSPPFTAVAHRTANDKPTLRATSAGKAMKGTSAYVFIIQSFVALFQCRFMMHTAPNVAAGTAAGKKCSNSTVIVPRKKITVPVSPKVRILF